VPDTTTGRKEVNIMVKVAETLVIGNVKMEVNGDELIAKVDLSKTLGQSKSGKSTVIATTSGNIAVPGRPDIKIGVTVYRKV